VTTPACKYVSPSHFSLLNLLFLRETMKKLFLLLWITLSLGAYAQKGGVPADTNKTDATGRKQGFWKDVAFGLAWYGYYQDNKREGVWVCYHPGQVLPQFIETYRSGKKNGISIATDAYANFMKEEYYTNDTLDGQCKYFYDNAKLKSLTTYKMGVLHGPKKVNYNDGKPQEEAHYQDGKKHGVSKWFYNGGALMTEFNYKNGKQEGIQKNYYKSGKVQSEVNAVNNEYEGVMTEYYESGKVKATVNYVRGKRQGVYKTVTEDGKNVLVNVKYKDDLMDGEYREWFANGNLKLTGKYVMGKKNGVWKEYDDKGVINTMLYKDDQLQPPPKK
jgi:antitoxin component YwqK of YwqJK toxin-antitoxin module